MSTSTSAADSGIAGSSRASERPYSPSWLERLMARFEALPGPTWAAYLVVFVGATLLMHALPWSQGKVPLGTPDPASLYFGALAPTLLWLTAYLERAAASAFDAGRPGLTVSAAEADRLRYELTIVPARPALLLAVLGAVLSVGGVASDPATYITGVPAPVTLAVYLLQSIYTAILFHALYRMIRQMNLVRRILDEAIAIDIFRPGQLNGFAVLTARPGIIISVLVGASVPISTIPSNLEGFLVGSAPYIVLPPIIAIIVFVVPLRGAHARLVEQKARLQDEAETRLEAVLADLNRDVDARDMARADGLNKTLSSLLLQRDILAKLPTWPWSTGTLRGFVTAILLPMVVFLAEQAVTRVF